MHSLGTILYQKDLSFPEKSDHTLDESAQKCSESWMEILLLSSFMVKRKKFGSSEWIRQKRLIRGRRFNTTEKRLLTIPEESLKVGK